MKSFYQFYLEVEKLQAIGGQNLPQQNVTTTPPVKTPQALPNAKKAEEEAKIAKQKEAMRKQTISTAFKQVMADVQKLAQATGETEGASALKFNPQGTGQ